MAPRSRTFGASSTTTGVAVSIGSSVAFGVIYFLIPLLAPMSALEIWGFRTAFSLPLITGVLLALRSWDLVLEVGRRMRRRPLLLLGQFAAAAILAVQVWLFSWAPLNGRALQVSLGYFLLPLVLVILGRLLYKDRMAWWQWAAAGIATAGVVYEVFRIGGISWETMLVALGYPFYFVLRRSMGTGHFGGMWWEMALLVPLAAVVLVWSVVDGSAFAANPALWWAAPGISIFAAFSLLLYVLASRLLSLSVFGLLSYGEPALLMVASLLMGERIATGEWFTYGAIWAAVLVLIAGGLISMRRPRDRFA